MKIFQPTISGSLTVSGSSVLSGSLNVTQGITGSLFGTSSWAVSASYATTASYALNGGGGAAFPYTGSAKITGSLAVTGSISSTADATINGLTVGRGGGNVVSNTALGYQALLSNSTGQGNIAIGYQAGYALGNSYSTTIGGVITPDLASFGQDYTLNIAKDTQYAQTTSGLKGHPHIWAPSSISVNVSSDARILTLDATVYAAAFLEYVMQDNAGSSNNMRAGTLRCIWNTSGEYRLTEEATDSIGTTIDYYFGIVYSSGKIDIKLYNNNASNKVAIAFTSRLLLRAIT